MTNFEHLVNEANVDRLRAVYLRDIAKYQNIYFFLSFRIRNVIIIDIDTQSINLNRIDYVVCLFI